MKNEIIFQAIGKIEEKYIEEASPHSDLVTLIRQKAIKRKWKEILTAVIAAAILLTTGVVAAANMGFNILEWIVGASTDIDPAIIQEQLEEGQWAYLNGDNIAVIVPESPVKIMLSSDAGETWSESTVVESSEWEFLGEWRDAKYWGGYIGFSGAENGYLVLTSGVAMNHQALRIFLTSDGGETWIEIESPYDQHISVLTGVGFASAEIGFIGYRYYEDAGPDIWWTRDGGKTWGKLEVDLPANYQGGQYRFTPLSPTFDGSNGVYPIAITDHGDDIETTIYMYSDDGGLSWYF